MTGIGRVGAWNVGFVPDAPGKGPSRGAFPSGPCAWTAVSDFTDMADAGVSIAAQKLYHRLYHFVLAYIGRPAPLPCAKRHVTQTLGCEQGGQGPKPACRCAQRSP